MAHLCCGKAPSWRGHTAKNLFSAKDFLPGASSQQRKRRQEPPRGSSNLKIVNAKNCQSFCFFLVFVRCFFFEKSKTEEKFLARLLAEKNQTTFKPAWLTTPDAQGFGDPGHVLVVSNPPWSLEGGLLDDSLHQLLSRCPLSFVSS